MTISCFDFWKDGMIVEEGSEEWKEMSMKVKEACESYGCFLLRCDEINSKGAREELFENMKALFHLPQETKQQYISPRPFRSFSLYNYMNTRYETFGLDDVLLSISVDTLANLMWPQGNPHFCETLKGMSLKMSEVSWVILKMIVEGYGLSHHHISDVENMKSSSDVRLNMYITDKSNAESKYKSNGHIDKNTLTILCQNKVQGLQVLSKTGTWIDIVIPENCFVVIVGDALKAWSNGRLHAAIHRVMVSEEKERYTFGAFVAPKDEMKIEVSRGLGDDKIHPLRYRPFNYGEFLNFVDSTRSSNLENALEVFAGF
ncbi:2-oxoglutarate-dependent dioxygenase AOP3-like [Vigna radiata var. radiata]|uniref:2-oxoglutarate-dependent dioxygenase DAO n=1 Tax=Vigna radiata var. radiata TaxID=3916 RepID=A0A1S3TZX7_VIGRR|nr:2-oxoglutarate-dependent dioxygenase AOP3-like [Vigna radiata var. radiata]